MKTFDSYRLFITPLSPTHIGTGESYEPTNYVIQDGVLHEFDSSAVMKVLSMKDREILLNIANGVLNAGMIESVQRFFYERRTLLMAHAIQCTPVLPGVATLYDKRVGQTANREADGRKVVNRLEIDRTSFNPITRQPVLFGSSMKGAIRTALLDKINNEAGLQKVINHRTNKPRDENNMELQQRLFKYTTRNLELDPMRLVQLSDAVWQGEAGLPAAQVHLAVNRKKTVVLDEQGKQRKSQAEIKELYQILECVAGWRYRAFFAQLNLQLVDSFDALCEANKKHPVKELRFDMARIVKACNDFYTPIMEAENQLMQERGYLDETWRNTMQQLLTAAKSKMQNGEAFLLRVGRHSGAESVTLRGVRSIKIMKGNGQQHENAETTKTFWLAADEKDQSQNLLPFGWLLVEIQPLAVPAEEWIELKTACEPHLSTVREFAEKISQQQAALKHARTLEEARHREEEEKTRLVAVEAARKIQEAEECQARLAMLSKNMQRVEQLIGLAKQRIEQLRGNKEKPNSTFHTMARTLAKDALDHVDWNAEEKFAVADAIANWLPKVVSGIDKDQLKKLKLSMLRGNV